MAVDLLHQDALFDLIPSEPEPGPVRRMPRHAAGPRRSKEFAAQDCDPKCLVCEKKEGHGACDRCAVACTHVAEPAMAEVCIVTERVAARLATANDACNGHRHGYAVVDCPSCGELHLHAPAYGVRYRVSPCGRPYLVDLPRPRAVEIATHGEEQRESAAKGAEYARRLQRE